MLLELAVSSILFIVVQDASRCPDKQIHLVVRTNEYVSTRTPTQDTAQNLIYTRREDIWFQKCFKYSGSIVVVVVEVVSVKKKVEILLELQKQGRNIRAIRKCERLAIAQ